MTVLARSGAPSRTREKRWFVIGRPGLGLASYPVSLTAPPAAREPFQASASATARGGGSLLARNSRLTEDEAATVPRLA